MKHKTKMRLWRRESAKARQHIHATAGIRRQMQGMAGWRLLPSPPPVMIFYIDAMREIIAVEYGPEAAARYNPKRMRY